MSTDFESNRSEAEKLIERFRGATLPHFINGKHDTGRSGVTFDSIAPSDNSVIGSVAAGNADDIDAACKAAEDAFEDSFSSSSSLLSFAFFSSSSSLEELK